jgi:hypothetical protein
MLHEDDARHDGEPVREATLDGGGLLVYDRHSEQAWIQCDTPVDLSEYG